MALPTGVKQVGLAHIFGITGTPAIDVLANLTFKPQSLKFANKSTTKFLPDSIGYDAAGNSANEYIEATLDFILYADTLAHAQASAIMLTNLSPVALSGFDVTIANGTWLYIGDQTIDLATAQEGKMSIPLRKYVNATQNTNMTTVAS